MRSLFVVLLALILKMADAQTIETINAPDKSLSILWAGKERLSGGMPWFLISTKTATSVQSKTSEDVLLLSVSLKEPETIKAGNFAGLAFKPIHEYKHGVALWRYKPWNSWTKPLKIGALSDFPEWDVQFYYWQHNDGTYGAMLPLSGEGYRNTLGVKDNLIGSKSISSVDILQSNAISALAIAFGKDPYELFSRIYRVALTEMGRGDNLQSKKKFPEPLNYIGWCTWNSSDLGKNLNENLLFDGAKSFKDHKFPLGWMLFDDGWFQHNGSQLQSLEPDPAKFPKGFKPVVERLKKEFNLKYIGVWHALNGYWNGIDPDSPLGKHYENELFSWTQPERVDIADSPKKTYHFIKPESDSLKSFYDRWHKYLRSQDIDFIKVDNQLVVERMAVNNYPLFTLATAMHNTLNESTQKNFGDAIINCMDMTADAYLNFGSTPVARSVEDYFPYERGEGYDLQRGNAAAHVLQGIYNNIYFSQMVFPDLDMFQSHNPNAEFHAIARAINNGPIYITDNIGEQRFDILNALVYADGRIIKSETSLLPSEECLFQVQDKALLKAYSKVRKIGLLGVWNAADSADVKGQVTVKDVSGLPSGEYAIYERFSGALKVMSFKSKIDVTLSRMGYHLYYISPITNSYASFGLTNKYNAPATIVSEKWGKNKVEISVYEGGVFKAYSKKKPTDIIADGKVISTYKFTNGLIEIIIPDGKDGKHPVIVISW